MGIDKIREAQGRVGEAIEAMKQGLDQRHEELKKSAAGEPR